MLISPINIPPHLKSYIDSAYILNVTQPGTFSSIANCNSGLFFELDTYNDKVLFDHKEVEGSFIWGASSYPKNFSFLGPKTVLAVILKPYAPYYLFNLNMVELTDTTIPLSVLSKHMAPLLKEQRPVSAYITAIFHEISKILVDKHLNVQLAKILQHGNTAHQPNSVRALYKTLNISERSLERLLKKTTGIRPKMFLEINRFQQIYWSLTTDKQLLTTVAHNHYYSDQSHFTRTFKKYAGFLPSRMAINKDLII